MTNTFLRNVQQGPLCIDGAMGTMVQKLDLEDAHYGGPDFRMLVDLLCFSLPEAVVDVHLAFLRAGAQAVETNSFGASPFRLAEYDFTKLDTARFAENPYGLELPKTGVAALAYYLSLRAAELARTACERYRREAGYDGRDLFVIGSMGPSNHVISATTANLRRASFDAVAENFYRQALGLIDGGADVLLFETQQDILELKAGVFGARRAMRERGKTLPVMGQVTVDPFSRMQLFNTDIHAALVTVQGIGLDVFGINCSIGPTMEKTAERLGMLSRCRCRSCPTRACPSPKRAKPCSSSRRTSLPNISGASPDLRAWRLLRHTPEHIACTVEALKGVNRKPARPRPWSMCPAPEAVAPTRREPDPLRGAANIRGSKKVRDAIENDTGINHDVLDEVVREQVRDLGCQIIDVCMDSNRVDTVDTLREVVRSQTIDFPGAMSLDSFQPDALAEAVKVYPGRPILNSISLEESAPGVLKMDALIEATQGHDPVFVALCTGPSGPAATAADKCALAGQILDRAREKYGIAPERIFVDVNVFPIGSESTPGMNFTTETLEGIRLVKERYPGAKTILGVVT